MHKTAWIVACGLLAGCGVELNPMDQAATRLPDPTEAIAAAGRAATRPSQPPHVVVVPFPDIPHKEITVQESGPTPVYVPVPMLPDEQSY